MNFAVKDQFMVEKMRKNPASQKLAFDNFIQIYWQNRSSRLRCSSSSGLADYPALSQ